MTPKIRNTFAFALFLSFAAASGACVKRGTTPSGYFFDESHRDKVVEVPVGEKITVALAVLSKGVPRGYQVAECDPCVDGDAVKFVDRSRTPPTPGATGARGHVHYTFVAVSVGEAELTFHAQPVSSLAPRFCETVRHRAHLNVRDIRIRVVVMR